MPDTSCKMPSGDEFFRQQPQELCPLCDDDGWGQAWNLDLFPELAA